MLGWLFRKPTPPGVPERFTIEEGDYLTDGGTTELWGTDEVGRRRFIRLTQHMFPQWGGVGWLYLDRYRVPRRSETERAIVRLLHASLGELRRRPGGRRPGERTMAEELAEHGAVLFGSDDLAELGEMPEAERLIRLATDVLAYVESEQYGQVTP